MAELQGRHRRCGAGAGVPHRVRRAAWFRSLARSRALGNLQNTRGIGVPERESGRGVRASLSALNTEVEPAECAAPHRPRLKHQQQCFQHIFLVLHTKKLAAGPAQLNRRGAPQ